MTFETDADRLASIQAVGEQFDTGKPPKMWAIFDRPSIDQFGQTIPVKSRRTELVCRESDVTLHGLIKGSVITRIADGSKWTVREINPDGSGMVEIVLGA